MMEDLIEAFAVSQVTVQPNSTTAEHPHFALYKAKHSAVSQEERRKKFLEAQKVKRYDYVSHARKLATNGFGDEEEEEEKENSEEMNVEEYVKKPPRSYKNQLMYSEWLVEVPSDLESQWFLMLCPVGKRCLVVASGGNTKVFTKSGYRVNTFPSLLPGGNKSDGVRHAYSLLDCIFSEIDKTYYILDVMCWNSHPCFDSETEFRFFWIHSKIEESPEVKVISKRNPYKFIPLPFVKCDTESIKNVLWSPLPFSCKLDGLLFYHKKTHYTPGTTPLVGWLKAYMVPELLNIEVPETLCSEKPVSYVSMRQHLPKAFEKYEERKKEDEQNMQYEDD